MSDQGNWGPTPPGPGWPGASGPPPSGPPPHYGQQPPQQWGQQPQYGQQPPQQWGQAQPPPWAQPPYGYQPAPKPGGNKTLIIVLVAVLVLAGLGVGGYFLFAGGDGSQNTGNSPRGVANRFYQAAKKHDTTSLEALFCTADRKKGVQGTLDDLNRVHVTSYSITDVQQKGDEAVVSARVTTTEKGTNTGHLPMLSENGQWRLCFTGGTTVEHSTSASLQNSGPVPVPSPT